jgi:hypothetical protein
MEGPVGCLARLTFGWLAHLTGPSGYAVWLSCPAVLLDRLAVVLLASQATWTDGWLARLAGFPSAWLARLSHPAGWFPRLMAFLAGC